MDDDDKEELEDFLEWPSAAARSKTLVAESERSVSLDVKSGTGSEAEAFVVSARVSNPCISTEETLIVSTLVPCSSAILAPSTARRPASDGDLEPVVVELETVWMELKVGIQRAAADWSGWGKVAESMIVCRSGRIRLAIADSSS